jgi:hypothetical protein
MGFSFPSWLQVPGLEPDLDMQKIDGLLRWQEKNFSQSPFRGRACARVDAAETRMRPAASTPARKIILLSLPQQKGGVHSQMHGDILRN